MQRVPFVVEGFVRSRGIVMCHCLEVTNFRVAPGSMLGGKPVSRFDIPRKTLPNGQQDPNAFGFFLSNREDVEHFVNGQEVWLETP